MSSSMVVGICPDCGGYITDSVIYGVGGWDTYVKRDKHDCPGTPTEGTP